MKWLKIAIYLLILYAVCHQQLYSSSLAKENTDHRAEKISAYLAKWQSPLEPEAAYFVKTTDAYKLDYRLLPAIAGVESSFETAGNTHDFNPFGLMCKGSPCVFENYRQAIYTAAKTISGYKTSEDWRKTRNYLILAEIYCQGDNQAWTQNLNYFIIRL
jgi:hypothetical protein